MRLSWNEIRARAAKFAQDWAGYGYEKGQTQLFYRDFFEVFGMPVRRVAAFEEPVRNLGAGRGFIDLFWRGVLLVEQKSVGRDLVKAKEQAFDYFPGIRNTDLPRYLLVSDFQNFELYDLDEDESVAFPLADLPRHVERFGFILGVQRRAFKDQDPVNIEAAELVGRLHDALRGTGYGGHGAAGGPAAAAWRAQPDRTGARRSPSEQEQAHAGARRDAGQVPCQCHSQGAVPCNPEGQFRAPRICPDRVARTASNSERLGLRA
jgi:hypothetical protein